MSRIRNPFFPTRSTDSRSKSRIRNARFAPEILDRKLSPSSIMPLDTATTSAEIYVMTDSDMTTAPDSGTETMTDTDSTLLPPDSGTEPVTETDPTPPPPDSGSDDMTMFASEPAPEPDPTPTPDGDGEPPIVVTPPPTGPSGPAVVDASSDVWCP